MTTKTMLKIALSAVVVIAVSAAQAYPYMLKLNSAGRFETPQNMQKATLDAKAPRQAAQPQRPNGFAVIKSINIQISSEKMDIIDYIQQRGGYVSSYIPRERPDTPLTSFTVIVDVPEDRQEEIVNQIEKLGGVCDQSPSLTMKHMPGATLATPHAPRLLRFCEAV